MFVPVGTDGKVRIFNNQGNTHVVVDVVGYMLGKQDRRLASGRVVPLTSPFRTFDTRLAAVRRRALGPGQAEDWSFADFASSVAIGGSVGNQIGRDRQPHRRRSPASTRRCPSARTSRPTRPASSDLVEPQHHEGRQRAQHGRGEVRAPTSGAGVQHRRLRALLARRLSVVSGQLASRLVLTPRADQSGASWPRPETTRRPVPTLPVEEHLMPRHSRRAATSASPTSPSPRSAARRSTSPSTRCPACGRCARSSARPSRSPAPASPARCT